MVLGSPNLDQKEREGDGNGGEGAKRLVKIPSRHASMSAITLAPLLSDYRVSLSPALMAVEDFSSPIYVPSQTPLFVLGRVNERLSAASKLVSSMSSLGCEIVIDV